jgi:hypothetical protein
VNLVIKGKLQLLSASAADASYMLLLHISLAAVYS